MSITSDANSTFLEVDNAHLRVSGDIHATSVKVGAIEILPGYSLESTTVIGNTTSQTIQFTNTETSLVTSGDINMLHSSNNAAIKLNSNVVTEFPRSKKLIKYPRVALTSASQDGYVASASRENGVRQAYTAFDGDDTTFWQIVNSPDRYDTNGNATSDATLFEGDNGEWIKILLPDKVKISSIRRRATGSTRRPTNCKLYGSNDDTTWDLLEDITFSNTDWADGNLNTNNYYNYFVLQVLTVSGNGQNVDMKELELYGTPEYDPDADGVDVKVTSYPNVPNTDWLEVYYDAKGLEDGTTTVNDLKPSGTANNGVANGNLSVSDGAFTFDGSGDYISTSITTSMTVHTASMWIQFDRSGSGWECVYSIGPSSGLDRNNFNLYNNDGYFRLESVGNTGPYFDFIYDFEIGKWVHLTLVFRGSGLEDCEMYINNERLLPRNSSRNSSDDITITGTNNVYIGNDILNAYYHDGKIANFRLFNRALTSDEVWQLYAYQKEYFGHGDLGMTLKAGRLGIGTSEPRAALDVRGDIHGGMPVFFDARFTSAPTATHFGTRIVFDTLNNSRGGGFDTSTGIFTAPIAGQYKFSYFMRGNQLNQSFKIKPRINGSPSFSGLSDGTDQNLLGTAFCGNDGIQGSAVCIVSLEVGGTFELILSSHASTISSALASFYNGFTGEYISSL